ncbi:protein RTF1 homolog [Coffea arabica]|uniref:Protein RTF1 homolog n=1 Tax=Coffea arabica TaxID=13443 RepID=A0A6P6WAY3_COFAR|nr:protein RTF1 homolog [Coffea arabica]XP_027111747.1 protein RTF1 homolog [Coffea arabica]
MAEEEELDDLLLEAAGRTGESERRRRKVPYSDDESDSKDDDYDDDHAYSNRKPSGSQVPLKKRLDPLERDEDDSNHEEDGYHEGDSDDDSVGSDLYKDEDDRKKLAQMSELQREMILADRASTRSDREMHEKFAKKRKGSPTQTHSRAVRSSTRFADRAAAKDDALNEIRAKRMRQQDPEAHRKLRDATRDGSGSRGYSPVKRRPFTAATIGSPTRSGSASHSDEEESTGDGGMADSDDDKTSAESKWPTYEDIKEITIRRSKLAKWFMEPFFEDLIVGCFVRVGIGKNRYGPIYRLCVVRNVDGSDPDRLYKLDNKTTYKYLNVVWGNENSAARWQMAMISDSPPAKEEYDQWVREVERSGGRMPSKLEVLEKKEAIQKTNSFVYSAETVKQMLQEKKSATWRPLNVAAEKDRLRTEMEVAKINNDELEVERIKARLQELEASRQAHEMDKKAIRLAEMNRKNRVENFKNASGLKPVNAGLKAGEAGYDPFSRRWTRSRNYYVKNPIDGEAAAADGEATAASAVDNRNGTAVVSTEMGKAATAAADDGKLVDTSAPVDQGRESNMLHGFKLEINLDPLENFGGAKGAQAGFMARKQRIEATVGCRVPENDGRRHVLTLTVSDYKRRMGLL